MKKTKKTPKTLPFGKILRGIMTDRGLTLRAVAEMAGVNSSVVQGWLNHTTPHDLQAISRLAQALGVSFKGLLLGEQEENATKVTAAELFDEQDLFEGICKVSIKRLVERKKS